MVARVAMATALCCGAAACQQTAAPAWQGWIEADTLFVGPEDSGRITELAVAEGQTVRKGDFLFAVDTAVQTADVAAAQAALDQAKARLARAEAAQQRPEEVAVIEASRREAHAALDFSTVELDRIRALNQRGNATRQQLEQAQSNFDRDQAAVENVLRQIDVAKMGGRVEDIDAARATVDQMKAQRANAQARLARARITAPADGGVQEIYFRAGEVASSSRPVVALLPPGNLKLRFFVGESDLSRMKIGAPVAIACDNCSGDLAARVSFIASRSEFTPPVIFSLEERRKLVFKVEARLDRPELFRVGQPVTVRLAAP